jgi:hypothetical protein
MQDGLRELLSFGERLAQLSADKAKKARTRHRQEQDGKAGLAIRSPPLHRTEAR